jgi:hypothetical protein
MAEDTKEIPGQPVFRVGAQHFGWGDSMISTIGSRKFCVIEARTV